MFKKLLLFLGLIFLLVSAGGFTWLALNAPQQNKTTTTVSARELAPPTIFAIVILPTATPELSGAPRATSTRVAVTAAAQPTRMPLPPVGAPPTAAALQPTATRTVNPLLESKSGGGPGLPPESPPPSTTATPMPSASVLPSVEPTRDGERPGAAPPGGVVIATAAPTPVPPRPRVIDAEWPRTLEKGRTGNVRISLVQADEKTYTPVISSPNNTAVVGTPITLGTPGVDLSAQFGANYDAYVSANLAGAAFNIDALVKEPQSLEQPDITWTWSVLAKEERTQTLNALINIEWRPRGGGAPIQRTLWRSQFTVDVGQAFLPMDLFGLLNALTAFVGSVLSGPWVIEKLLEVRRSRKKAHAEPAKG